MPSDVVLSRELKSLQEEVSASQKECAAAAAAPVLSPVGAPIKDTPDERELSEQLRQFADEITDFFDEAENSIAAHPTQSVMAAMLVGIMIGWVLGRR